MVPRMVPLRVEFFFQEPGAAAAVVLALLAAPGSGRWRLLARLVATAPEARDADALRTSVGPLFTAAESCNLCFF